jgi:hypothetical protein
MAEHRFERRLAVSGYSAVAAALADLPPSGLSADPSATSVLIGSRALTHWVPSRAPHDWDVVMPVESVRHWLRATDSRLFSRIQLVVLLPVDLDVDATSDVKSSTGTLTKAAEPTYAVGLNGFCADGGSSCPASSSEAGSSGGSSGEVDRGGFQFDFTVVCGALSDPSKELPLLIALMEYYSQIDRYNAAIRAVAMSETILTISQTDQRSNASNTVALQTRVMMGILCSGCQYRPVEVRCGSCGPPAPRGHCRTCSNPSHGLLSFHRRTAVPPLSAAARAAAEKEVEARVAEFKAMEAKTAAREMGKVRAEKFRDIGPAPVHPFAPAGPVPAEHRPPAFAPPPPPKISPTATPAALSSAAAGGRGVAVRTGTSDVKGGDVDTAAAVVLPPLIVISTLSAPPAPWVRPARPQACSALSLLELCGVNLRPEAKSPVVAGGPAPSAPPADGAVDGDIPTVGGEEERLPLPPFSLGLTCRVAPLPLLEAIKTAHTGEVAHRFDVHTADLVTLRTAIENYSSSATARTARAECRPFIRSAELDRFAVARRFERRRFFGGAVDVPLSAVVSELPPVIMHVPRAVLLRVAYDRAGGPAVLRLNAAASGPRAATVSESVVTIGAEALLSAPAPLQRAIVRELLTARAVDRYLRTRRTALGDLPAAHRAALADLCLAGVPDGGPAASKGLSLPEWFRRFVIDRYDRLYRCDRMDLGRIAAALMAVTTPSASLVASLPPPNATLADVKSVAPPSAAAADVKALAPLPADVLAMRFPDHDGMLTRFAAPHEQKIRDDMVYNWRLRLVAARERFNRWVPDDDGRAIVAPLWATTSAGQGTELTSSVTPPAIDIVRIASPRMGHRPVVGFGIVCNRYEARPAYGADAMMYFGIDTVVADHMALSDWMAGTAPAAVLYTGDIKTTEPVAPAVLSVVPIRMLVLAYMGTPDSPKPHSFADCLPAAFYDYNRREHVGARLPAASYGGLHVSWRVFDSSDSDPIRTQMPLPALIQAVDIGSTSPLLTALSPAAVSGLSRRPYLLWLYALAWCRSEALVLSDVVTARTLSVLVEGRGWEDPAFTCTPTSMAAADAFGYGPELTMDGLRALCSRRAAVGLPVPDLSRGPPYAVPGAGPPFHAGNFMAYAGAEGRWRRAQARAGVLPVDRSADTRVLDQYAESDAAADKEEAEQARPPALYLLWRMHALGGGSACAYAADGGGRDHYSSSS